MNEISFLSFSDKCKNNQCVRHTIFNKKTCLKKYKQKTCYQKYLGSLEKREVKKEKDTEKHLEWVAVRDKVFERDNYECQYLKYLKKTSLFDYVKAMQLLEGDMSCDPAHIFGRAVRVDLKYAVDNVVTLSHAFHSALDNYKHPISNNSISKETRYRIFYDMIGAEQTLRLIKLKERN